MHSLSNNKSSSYGSQSVFEPWLRLSLIPGLGSLRVQSLLRQFETPEHILSASLKELSQGIPEKVAQAIVRGQRSSTIEKQINAAKSWLDASEAHHILCPNDSNYPPQLKQLPDPPSILYVIGNPSLLSGPQVSIVGSRRPTPQGRRMAIEIAEQLARSGFIITSGLAMGIDGAAHQGALSCYGNTIAVLGTGVDQVYPRSHRTIYTSIIDQGALVSEYPIGTAPHPSNFPRRNRIISGLSLGLLVVEAALESGSLISARLAAEQGREVFAMPGSVINPMAKGCHKLIREGAILVETVEDILIELRPCIQQILLEPAPQSMPELENLSAVQNRILAKMGFDVISLDILCSLCALPYSELSVHLTELELSGIIESVPGGYIRVN